MLSGHDLSLYDWASLKAVDTLVVMMGSKSLARLADMLRDSGWPSDTKVKEWRTPILDPQFDDSQCFI